MLKAYQHALQKNPYQVKVASAVVIFSIGDLLAQLYPQFVKQKENHEKITPSLYTIDAKRTLVTVSYGVFLTTSVHHWWQFLEPRVNRLVDPVKSKLSNAFVKVALDQSVGAQFVNMGFFAIQGAMGSGSVTHVSERQRASLVTEVCFCDLPTLALVRSAHAGRRAEPDETRVEGD